MHQGDHPLVRGMNFMDIQASEVKANAEIASLTVPDAVRTAAAPRVNVQTTKLADGVWLLAGGSHNSVAVEFRNYVALVECPLGDARADAVIAAVKRNIPRKPIRYVVNTHHHFDHSGGLRACVAEGATILTDERNKDYFQRIVLGPQSRSLEPDRLSQFAFAPTGPGPLMLQTFTDSYAITDGQRSIILYHVESNHAEDMLIAYVPHEKIVINGDLYGPPPAGTTPPNVNPNSVALFRTIKRLKLEVAQHVPIHGNPGSNADFERIVGPVAARTPAPGGGGE